jgi:tRNA modification GTPase
MQDTIVALITPPGRSGIGVIRLSGNTALEITRKLMSDENFQPEPRYAVLKKVYEPESNSLIDETVITYFKSPQSFTGEDVVEISSHGSPIILRQLIDLCLKYDARQAQPGEFSLRALSNGRMNLSQAEAIRDLIDAQTVASARQAVRQLRGELSNQLQPLKDKLLNVIVVLESTLEFVEDDLPDFQAERIKENLLDIAAELNKTASTFRAGRLLREGLKITLAGRPNVGKSSLFNALLGHDRAIVTDIAGTTRDSLHEVLSIKGIPISLIDTAGLRETVDTVEKIGVERTKRVMADADLVIVVLDGSEDLNEQDKQVLSETESLNRIIVVNKTDLNNFGLENENSFNRSKVVKVSAKTGEGLDELENSIVLPFVSQDIESQGFLVSDARHYDLLLRAKTEIENSVNLLENKISEEIILIGLHNAMRYLGDITGETTTEDMLTRIFSTFCIGK